MKLRNIAVVSGLAITLALAGAGTAAAGGSAGPCPEARACGSAPKTKGSTKSSSARPKIVPAKAKDPWGHDGYSSGGWYME